jgi:hypothetical protein
VASEATVPVDNETSSKEISCTQLRSDPLRGAWPLGPTHRAGGTERCDWPSAGNGGCRALLFSTGKFVHFFFFFGRRLSRHLNDGIGQMELGEW